jgi:hypothetical protein
METLTDDNAIHPGASIAIPASQDMGRVFTFAGITLKPYSTAREQAFWRIGQGNEYEKEDAIYLVYICTLSPVECCAIRGAEINKYRADAMEWLDDLERKAKKNLIGEVIQLHKEIKKDRDDARSIEPDAPKSGNA